jgi:hypothetical protein
MPGFIKEFRSHACTHRCQLKDFFYWTKKRNSIEHRTRRGGAPSCRIFLYVLFPYEFLSHGGQAPALHAGSLGKRTLPVNNILLSIENKNINEETDGFFKDVQNVDLQSCLRCFQNESLRQY